MSVESSRAARVCSLRPAGRVGHDVAELGGQHADHRRGRRGGDALAHGGLVGGAQGVEPGLVAGQEHLQGGGIQILQRRHRVRHGVLRSQRQGIGNISELQVQIDQHGLPGSPQGQSDCQVAAHDRLAAPTFRRDHSDHPGLRSHRDGGDGGAAASRVESLLQLGPQFFIGKRRGDHAAHPGSQSPAPCLGFGSGHDQDADGRVVAIEVPLPIRRRRPDCRNRDRGSPTPARVRQWLWHHQRRVGYRPIFEAHRPAPAGGAASPRGRCPRRRR